MNKFLTVGVGVMGVMTPYFVYAAPRSFSELVNRIVTIVDLITPTLITLAILFFMYNILGSFGIFDGDSTSGVNKEKFKTSTGWGIVIIFIAVSIWGILQLLENTLFSSDAFSTSTSFGDEEIVCDLTEDPSCFEFR